MTYFIEYNGKFIKSCKTIKSCINHIERKHLTNDCDNVLRIFDQDGNEYNTVSGKEINY